MTNQADIYNKSLEVPHGRVGKGVVLEPPEGPHPTDGNPCPYERCGGKVHIDATKKQEG